MIINVKKYLIYGSQEDVERFFKSAQKSGFIEFIHPSLKKGKETSDEVKQILSALKILKKQPVQKQQESLLDPISLAKKTIHAQEVINQLQEKERFLLSEIARIAPFGEFSFESIESLKKEGNRIVQFLAMKSKKAEKKQLDPELIYIQSAYDLDYFIAINKEKKSYPDMIDMHMDRSLSDMKQELQYVREKIHQILNELKGYGAYLSFLYEALKQELNKHHLLQSQKQVQHPLTSIFTIEAWIPTNKIEALEHLTQHMSVEFEEIKLDQKDRKPTYMENKGWSKVGEDLVHIYDTPADTDTDPSNWVLVFFSLFFALVVSDAGYGLLYLALGLFLKWKCSPLKGMAKRFVKLVILLGSCTVIWGICIGSFFGIDLGVENPLRKFSVLHFLAKEKTNYHISVQDDVYEYWLGKFPNLEQVKDPHEFMKQTDTIKEGKVQYEALIKFYDNILMEFSILIGVIHLTLSFLRYLRRNWSGIGWIIFMIGGYLYFPSQLNATSFIHFLNILDKPIAFEIGQYLVYFGIGSAVLLALVQRGIAAGLSELMNVVQVFADVLSYLRLYALALAGMIMGSTFNDIGIAMGLEFGFIVVIIGHLVNIVLGIMGGVIHGLRLNFLEWYHYSFEGGGRRFDPLKLLK